MADSGLLDYILSNTDAEVKAKNKYTRKLEKEIREYQKTELRKRIAGSICFPLRLGG